MERRRGFGQSSVPKLFGSSVWMERIFGTKPQIEALISASSSPRANPESSSCQSNVFTSREKRQKSGDKLRGKEGFLKGGLEGPRSAQAVRSMLRVLREPPRVKLQRVGVNGTV
ncbi:hypothetical protein WMY93_015214 [Mugilogobius chulae]|uniref:Uncharacterized protein n=1 Tax=Mugilogobius chulae TaxID=88201 RepID=A0AAW0P0Y7_9GOBI